MKNGLGHSMSPSRRAVDTLSPSLCLTVWCQVQVPAVLGAGCPGLGTVPGCCVGTEHRGLSSRGESGLLAPAKGPREGVRWPGLVVTLDLLMPG